jgi:hypothetical protein
MATEISMSKFKIEKGVSRITRVKLQASIEESIAADLALMSEWSNNDKNYIVNELLRFALSQDIVFQAYKQSASSSHAEPKATVVPTSGRPRAVLASKTDPTAAESGSGARL